MQYEEMTSPELERRLEELIADRVLKRLNAQRLYRDAVIQGVKRGQSKYIAQLMPAKAARKRA